MRTTHVRTFSYLVALALTLWFPAADLLAQRNRISGKIDNSRRVELRGHIHPKALAENDQGEASPSLTLPYVTLVLKRSASQEADLSQLLADQQNPASPNYHHWLTPEEYADRFGASQDDIDKIVSWLRDQRLSVVGVARGRNWVAFSGSAAEVESAFGTKIHRYRLDGKMHFANAIEPSLPAGLEVVVSAIHGLNDFRLKAPKRALAVKKLDPAYTSSRGVHYLAPDDVATIYNIKPLYSAGVDGSGQKLVVVGQTAIKISDIQAFRTRFNLPAKDPQVILIPDSTDPGIITDDLAEADLDIELSGAVARNADILYIYAPDVSDAAQYAIDQNLAPVLTMSYGLCEALTPRSDAMSLQASAKQANAQGITWFAASGDSGATDCDGGDSRPTGRLSVDLPAGVPEVTGVGGTTFAEGSGSYWNSTSDTNGASVLSYIQESAWNDTAASDLAASGGGASVYFSKPSWQTGAGVPNDNARSVPDIAFAASANHDGFMIYTDGSLAIIGGTSAGAPSVAGIAVLLNHYLVSGGVQTSAGLGNINPRLYALAQSAPDVFHDVTTGDNIITVTCTARSRNCSAGTFGFNAGAGYDQVTGLGSVDAYKLVTTWHDPGSVATLAAAALTLRSNAGSITPGESATLTATVSAANGGTPSGSVSFYLNGTLLGDAPLAGAGGTATASLDVSGTQLAGGDGAVTAQYSGDRAYSGASASVTISVISGGSSAPSISSLANGASFRQAYAPGTILTVFGSQLAPAVQSADSVPLPSQLAGVSATINGVAAPLYYVAPGQMNLQIPYQTAANSTAVLRVSNNGLSTPVTFAVAAAAPGIFTDQTGAPVPDTSAARGQVITLYITGAGAVSPAIASGVAPAAGTAIAELPKPMQAVTVTVGGVQAPVQFAGTPPGLVGVTQINYQVPAGTAIGAQPVVVTIGGVASAPATLQVKQ
jgi:uncharacterized protein (TIGR03437 family)